MLNKLFIGLQYLLPQHGLSRLVGKLANCRVKVIKNILIHLFISHYRVNLSEAAEQSLDRYETFNHFFTRQLDLSKRTIDSAANSIISPADGTLSQFGRIEKSKLIQAKDQEFELSALLHGIEPNKFIDGAFATIYLSPRDYHRVHLPIDGELVAAHYIPGKLFSVNETTATAIPELFAKNERLVCLFKNEHFEFAVIFVGAMIVASIHTTWAGKVTPDSTGEVRHWFYEHNGWQFKKGDEIGYFEMGSTVIMLFPKEAAAWNEGLLQNQSIRMGQPIGELGA